VAMWVEVPAVCQKAHAWTGKAGPPSRQRTGGGWGPLEWRPVLQNLAGSEKSSPVISWYFNKFGKILKTGKIQSKCS
jgi:hypothetical protein